MIVKQRYVAPAAVTALAAGVVVRRARKQREECAGHAHGFRRLGRRVHS